MRHAFWGFLVAFMYWTTSPSSSQASDIIVLTSANTPIYSQTAQAFRQHLASQTSTEVLSLDGRLDRAQTVGERIRASHPRLVFAVGLKAALTATAEFPDTPTLFSMVMNPEDYGLPTGRMVGIRHRVPLALQLEQIRALLPKARRIGLLYDGTKSGALVEEAQAEAKKFSLQIVKGPIPRREEVTESLQALLPKIDLLWVVQDHVILSEETIDAVLRSTLRQKIPVFTFSATMVQRGGLAALTVQASDIGKQAASVAQDLLAEKRSDIPAILDPKYVRLALNLNTAEFLGLSISQNVVQTAGLLVGGPGDMAKNEKVVLEDLIQ